MLADLDATPHEGSPGDADSRVDVPSPDASAPRGGRLRRRLGLVAALAAYPVLYMAPVLSPRGHARLADVGGSSLHVTDLDGAIVFAQAVQSMRWPWSNATTMSFPTGESIWRWQTITQIAQVAMLWLATRIFSPLMSVNLLVLAGWICTGWAVFALARRLGASTRVAVACAVLAEMLPALPVQAANYTSYVWIGVPLFVLVRVIDLGRSPSVRNLLWLYGAVGVTVCFDPYWAYFAACIAVIGVLVHARPLLVWQRTAGVVAQLLLGAGLVAPVLAFAATRVLEGQGGAGQSRPLEVAPLYWVLGGLRSPTDWASSGPDGVGVVVLVLALLFAGLVLYRRADRGRVTAVVAVVVMAAISTGLPQWLRVDMPWGPLRPPAAYVRLVMPGVRFFQRAALVAEPVLCVFAVMAAVALARRAAARAGRPFVAGVVLVGLAVPTAVELAPLADRTVSHRWDDFAEIRAELSSVDRPAVLALPFERFGRQWMELWMLGDVPLQNQLYRTDLMVEVDDAIAEGPGGLAAFLRDRGVTHVLVSVPELSSERAAVLDDPRFVPVATIVLDGYESPPVEGVLYAVQARPDDRCTVCASSAVVAAP